MHRTAPDTLFVLGEHWRFALELLADAGVEQLLVHMLEQWNLVGLHVICSETSICRL